jgi:transmembrane sensor
VSDPADIDIDRGNAAAIEEQASLWAQKKHFSNWTQADETLLDKWLSEALAHRIAYIRLDAALMRTRRLAALRAPGKEHAVQPVARSLVTRIAAVFIVLGLLGGGGFVLYRPNTTTEATYSTPKGGRQTIALADGSRIELNTDTTLRIALDKNTRKAWLEKGEAYFQVRHNANRPFTVYAGNQRVIDLGTKFLLRRGPGRLDVALLEGRIQLETKAGHHPTVLSPGDSAIVMADSVSVTRKDAKDLIAKLGWRRGVVTFDRTTLADAVAELNRYNNRKLVVSDPRVARITIGGTFDVNNVDTFIDIAREDFGLHVSNRGDETVITK